MSDPWKRKEYNKQERYPQQIEIQLNKTADATDEEWDEWQEKELDWWAEKQIPIVALMAFVQLFMFGSMLMIFYIINLGVK